MVVAMMVLTGCESTVETTWDDVDDIPAPVELEDALIAGSPTRDRSEIGRTVIGGGGCTGTLISDRVMVSARHCLQYTTCEDRECVEKSRVWLLETVRIPTLLTTLRAYDLPSPEQTYGRDQRRCGLLTLPGPVSARKLYR